MLILRCAIHSNASSRSLRPIHRHVCAAQALASPPRQRLRRYLAVDTPSDCSIFVTIPVSGSKNSLLAFFQPQNTLHVVVLDERARAAALQVAQAIGDAIERPFLPAAPGERQCEHCDYRVVCGPYEERRVARKPQGNLEPLLALRASP